MLEHVWPWSRFAKDAQIIAVQRAHMAMNRALYENDCTARDRLAVKNRDIAFRLNDATVALKSQITEIDAAFFAIAALETPSASHTVRKAAGMARQMIGQRAHLKSLESLAAAAAKKD
jgi:hypothetical protein